MKKLRRLLNLDFLETTENSGYGGKDDFPTVGFELDDEIDFLCLYKDKKDYLKTEHTCICFYQYDRVFDNINGLFCAIYYHNEKLLNEFRERFSGVKYAIEPDYSQCGDIPFEENRYRCFRARIVNVWLTMNCDILVLPNISYVSPRSKEYIFQGIEKGSAVAFSVKGSLKKREDRELICQAVKETVDVIAPTKIVVYSVSTNMEQVLELFSYAIAHNVEIIFPDNSLLMRNRGKKGAK